MKINVSTFVCAYGSDVTHAPLPFSPPLSLLLPPPPPIPHIDARPKPSNARAAAPLLRTRVRIGARAPMRTYLSSAQQQQPLPPQWRTGAPYPLTRVRTDYPLSPSPPSRGRTRFPGKGMTPLSHWFSFRYETLIGHITTT